LPTWMSRRSIVPVMVQAILLNSVTVTAAKTNNKKVRKTTSKNNNNKPVFSPKASGFLTMKDMLGRFPFFVV
ncbi:MAG: hypothetical protein ACK53Y_08475, partial [bacterium]